MKKTLLVACAICLTAQFIHAQNPLKPIFYVHTGISTTRAPADYQNYYNSGFNLGAGVGTLLSQHWEVRALVNLHDYELNDNGYLKSKQMDDATSMIDGGKSNVVTLLADIKYLYPMPQNDKIVPYFLGAVGLFHLNNRDIEIFFQEEDYKFEGTTQTVLGAGLGLGFDIRVEEHTYLMAEIRFDLGMTESEVTAIMPIKFGISIR
jgi:hypothetical protein